MSDKKALVFCHDISSILILCGIMNSLSGHNWYNTLEVFYELDQISLWNFVQIFVLDMVVW